MRVACARADNGIRATGATALAGMLSDNKSLRVLNLTSAAALQCAAHVCGN
jgi:hypothetical protein